jgi:hypothetical protein
MDSWLLKQSKSVESDINILGATISTVDVSPAEKNGRARKYQTDFLTFGFIINSTRKRCVVCGEVLTNIVSMEKNCVGT